MGLDVDRFSAWVTVDGMDSKCHHVVRSPDGKAVTCWIQSEAGKRFSVRWKDSLYYHTIDEPVANLFIDGIYCQSTFFKNRPRRFIREADMHNREDFTRMDMMKTSPTTSRYLTFPDVVPKNEPDTPQHLMRGHGTVILIIRKFKYEGWTADSPERYTHLHLPGMAPNDVSKQTTPSSHNIKLGDEIHHPSTPFFKGTFSPPLATFIFRYTSRDRLVAQGIIPSPICLPTPPMTESGHDSPSLSDSDLESDSDHEPARKRRRLHSETCLLRPSSDQKKRAASEEVLSPMCLELDKLKHSRNPLSTLAQVCQEIKQSSTTLSPDCTSAHHDDEDSEEEYTVRVTLEMKVKKRGRNPNFDLKDQTARLRVVDVTSSPSR